MATVHSSSQTALQVDWYYQGVLLDPASDTRYSEGVTESGSVHFLSVMNVDSDVLGRYSVVVVVDGRNATDTVWLMFPGK